MLFLLITYYLLFITFFIETLNSQLLKHRFYSMRSSSLLQSEHVDAVAEL